MHFVEFVRIISLFLLLSSMAVRYLIGTDYNSHYQKMKYFLYTCILLISFLFFLSLFFFFWIVGYPNPLFDAANKNYMDIWQGILILGE